MRTTSPREPYRLEPSDLGVRPGVDLTKALRLADHLEDEALLRKTAISSDRSPRIEHVDPLNES